MLVTGLTGFKGQWLGRWLKRLGAEVVGFGLPPRPDPFGRAPDVAAEFDCRTCDVCDRAAVQALVDQTRPQAIFHLAAQPLVRLSYAEPVETFAANVMGTVHVLDAARQCDATRVVVNVTSDKCYENREWHWAYREDEALGGHDPYSASKGCAELVTAAYRRSYAESGPLVASARAGNVIGGADWAEDRLVPDIARAIVAGEPVVIRRPEAIRPWQHVLEALGGYLMLGAGLLAGDGRLATAWNFGPPDADAVLVGELARRIVNRWGKGQVVERVDPQGPHEAHYLKLDSSRACAELGWKALLSMEERIDWTIDWYRAWLDAPERYWQLIDKQIANYDARMQTWLDQTRSSLSEPPASSARRSRVA